jgi:hypothetical protein
MLKAYCDIPIELKGFINNFIVSYWFLFRFLSKSFLGFAIFNIILYSLLIAELVLVKS